MKMTKVLTTAMILGTFTLSTGLIIAGNAFARGPMSLASYDMDGNGNITENEFNSAREKQQAEMQASGRAGRGMANAPSFADTDTNEDGQISAEELKTMQEKQQSGRGTGRGMGKGKGKGNQS
jgi:EF hand